MSDQRAANPVVTWLRAQSDYSCYDCGRGTEMFTAAADEIERLERHVEDLEYAIGWRTADETKAPTAKTDLCELLREAKAAFDCIAARDGQPRWDLAQRIDDALRAADETAAPTANQLVDELRKRAAKRPPPTRRRSATFEHPTIARLASEAADEIERLERELTTERAAHEQLRARLAEGGR